jgi:hypothetical protein
MVSFSHSLQLSYFDIEDPSNCISAPSTVSCLSFNSKWKMVKKNFDSSYNRQSAYTPVSLNNLNVNNNSIYGTVAVHNIAFEKKVRILSTFDNWISDFTIDCIYHKSVGNLDYFNFELSLPSSTSDCKFEFCISYETCGLTTYDNNFKNNFKITLARVLKESTRRKCLKTWSFVDYRHQISDFWIFYKRLSK